MDQATAVFSRRTLEEAERALGSSEGSGEGEAPASEGAATAGGSSSAASKGVGGAKSSADDTKGAVGADKGSGRGSEAPEGADAGSGDSGSDGGRPEAEHDAEDADTEREAEAAVEPEPEPASGTETETDSESERAAASDDGTAGKADTAAAGEEPEADEPGPEAVAEAETSTEAEAGARAESGASDKLKGDTDTDTDADTESESDEAGPESAADAGTVTEAEARVESPVSGESKGASEDEPGADTESAPEADSDADPAPKSAAPATNSGNGPEVDADADPGSDVESDKASKPPVDQPTATFKAVRPPAVDQPTTMLKLGDARPTGKPADEPADEPGDKATEKATDKATEKAPEPDKPTPTRTPTPEAERTSKFVALKPLDEPRPPKPSTAPPAPSAPPGTTPASPAAPADATDAIPQIGPEHTTQQPLPPKPPLDLLAELTNTPPPPPTPLRTLARRVKIWTPLAVLLAIVFAVAQGVRPLPTPTLALTADETYAFEGDKLSLPWPGEGQGWMDVNGIGTMDSFGERKAVPIGSVAKAMTAYVALKDHPLKSGDEGPSITVDALAEKEGGYDTDGESTLNTIKEGDKLSLQDAIAAIMIPSANNVARLLARWDTNGSEAEFVKKMNAAAKDLGMTSTTYTDPSGLKESTVSTAEDQVKLGNELVRVQALTDITKLPSWKDPSGKKWRNYNTLVPYDNAIGIKTGSTTKAGGNLLFAATKDTGGETVAVVGAILGQHTAPIIDTVNAVSKTAMLAAQDALTSDRILKKGDVVGYVDDGLDGHTPVVVTKDVSAVGWAGQTVKLALSEDGTTIPNEAKAGTKVGALTVGDGTGGAVEVPVALQEDLTEPGFGSRLTRIG